MKKIIIALGGNALENNAEPTAENQLKVIKSSVKNIADLIEAGYSVTITHGNGPQVGRIALQNEAAKAITPVLPFDVCGAMSQGMIGYHIQQALREELLSRNIKKPVVSVITQVLVDKTDAAFKNPTKPIGPFYSEKEAQELVKSKGYSIKEDSGRGFRRVVASPKPLKVIEIEAIKNLIDNKFIVITVGGGGIPVIAEENNKLTGVAAVIDKDFASAKLALDLDADLLIILTAVDKVALNFGKPNQSVLDELNIKDAEKYIAEGHFAAGSMLPKIQASLSFVKSKPNRKALITSLEKVKDALNNKNGTYIV